MLYKLDLETIKHISEKGFRLSSGEHSAMFVLTDKKGRICEYYGYSDDDAQVFTPKILHSRTCAF